MQAAKLATGSGGHPTGPTHVLHHAILAMATSWLTFASSEVDGSVMQKKRRSRKLRACPFCRRATSSSAASELTVIPEPKKVALTFFRAPESNRLRYAGGGALRGEPRHVARATGADVQGRGRERVLREPNRGGTAIDRLGQTRLAVADRIEMEDELFLELESWAGLEHMLASGPLHNPTKRARRRQ